MHDHDSVQSDPYDLARFVNAQADDYASALVELKAGRKRSHWMWYIFPQLDGLAFSSMSQRYSIKSIDEARAYLAHPELGTRLLECAAAVLAVAGRSITEIMGSPDDLKLRSCATLFASISDADSAFERILARYYAGQPDERTLALLERLNNV